MQQAAQEISPRRRRVVSAFVGVFILVHFAVLILGSQHWPILSYPMFSNNLEDGLECPVVFAVPEDTTKPEFRLSPKHSGLPTLTIPYAFAKMLRYPHRSPEFERFAAGCPAGTDDEQSRCVGDRLAGAALEFLYQRYEMIRKRAPDKMPALRGMRVYDVGFAPSPQFDKVYDVKSKQLRVEWTPGAGAGSAHP